VVTSSAKFLTGTGGTISSSGGRLRLNSSGYISVNSGCAITITAVITNGTATSFSTLDSSGGGTLILKGSNTFTSILLANSPVQAGVDSVGSLGNITSSALGVGPIQFCSGTQPGSLSSDGTSPRVFYNPITWTPNTATMTLGDAIRNGKLTFASTMVLGGSTRPIAVSSTVEFGGVISGNAGCGIIKTGSGTMILSAANTYTGPTTVGAGTLQLGNGTTDGVITNSSSLINSNAVVFNVAGSYTYTSISGTGSVSKSGSGTITLAGSTTYSGGTTVNNGTLILNSSVTGNVTVTGGTLGGTGVVAGVVTNNGTITAADITTNGTLTVTNLVMGEYSTYVWNSDATSTAGDLIQVNGTLTLPQYATVTVSRAGARIPSPGVLFAGFTNTNIRTDLSQWVINGVPTSTRAKVNGNQVVLVVPNGWLISIQ